jgi:hypothetical protein
VKPWATMTTIAAASMISAKPGIRVAGRPWDTTS